MLPVWAQAPRKVEASYSYYLPLTQSVLEGRRQAIEEAMLQALRNEFGTLVTEKNIQTLTASSDGEYKENYHMLGGSEVKGEWLETIGKPKVITMLDGQQIVLHVQIQGWVREIASTPIPLVIKPLRNGTTDDHQSEQFEDGDDFYLSFMTPVKGYVAVYLLDEDTDKVYQLLPYKDSDETAYMVQKDRRYVFFSPADATDLERRYVEDYTLSADHRHSWSDVYVVFSPNPFSKALSLTVTNGVKSLDSKSFFSWLKDVRKHDHQMNVNIFTLRVANLNLQLE